MTINNKVNLSVGRIADFKCPAGKPQAFLRDLRSPWLAVRATASGAKSFVFESKLNGATIREVIGDVGAWDIDSARQAANEKKTLVDRGVDPRQLKRDLKAIGESKALESQQKAAEAQRRSIKVLDVWPVYLKEGKPRRKEAWKPRYLEDLKKSALAGGEKKKRGEGVTKPGPLFPLMGVRLVEIDQDLIRDWFSSERKRGPTQAARALAMFAGFLSWCATKRAYRDLVDRDAAKAGELQDMLPAKNVRTDALEVGQLPAWFGAVEQLPNRTAAAYLVALLLTGARREEMAALKHEDIDYRWERLKLADKVGTTRTIPLTPYLKLLFKTLPEVAGNPFVFATAGSRSGRISEPRSAHASVLTAAGIGHCTIHGLRRSFALLGESSGAPAGAIAQVMGHRPSAMSEKYKPRPMDMLRAYLTQIEAFILEKAEVKTDGVGYAKG